MILLNRNNLAVRFAAPKDSTYRTPSAILVTENETVATDGHMMCRVSLPTAKVADFPTIDGFKANGFTRGLISLDSAKDIENAIPKEKNLTILNHAAISAEPIEGTEKSLLKVATTDLDTPKVFTVRQPETTYPNWDLNTLWPDRTKVTTDICVNAGMLAAIATAATKFSTSSHRAIRLRLYGSNSALRFDVVNDDGQEMNGLLMPLRASVEPTFKEPKPEPEPAEQEAA